MDTQPLLERIETLETRLAYTEYTVEQLSEELAVQGRELDKLRYQFQLLVEKFMVIQPSQVASMSEETPPPHY